MTKVYEFDGVSGEHSVRDATPTEIESLANTALKIENAAKEKAAAKAAVLERLGITADEAKLLLA